MTDEEVRAINEELRRSYRLCFGSPAGKAVMADLMAFCRFRVDVDGQIGEGQRRVFLRIVNLINLTDEQLYRLYGGREVGELTDE